MKDDEMLAMLAKNNIEIYDDELKEGDSEISRSGSSSKKSGSSKKSKSKSKSESGSKKKSEKN